MDWNKGMPNLEYLSLEGCRSLEEVHHSLKCCGKLIRLNLDGCKKFSEILRRTKPELAIHVRSSGIRKLSPCIFQHKTHLTEQDLKNYLGDLDNLVSLPSSIGMLRGLVKLDVSGCSKLETLPVEIGDLENLEELNARWTLILRPPSSIVCLNKLKVLSFTKYILADSKDVDLENFVFPQLKGGLRSLEILDLNYCNFIDGGLPEDIGCLSSLKELNLTGNNFEHLPQSIAQLDALLSLDLSYCERHKELPEFPQQLDRIDAYWSNDWICNSLFQNISSLQHDISASDSSSLRVFTSWKMNIPSWFHHQGTGTSVSVNLPENWYISYNFLGFAICYYGKLIDITAHLIPLCDDGMPSMPQKLALSNHSEYSATYFFLVPLSGLWDTSKANGKTPNDYGCIRLSFSGEMEEFGFRLLYKDEPAEHCIGTKRSRDDDSEHHDEASSSSCNDEPTEHCIGIRWSTSCCRIL